MMPLSLPFPGRRHERTPVDEALGRGHQGVVDIINGFSAPSREVAAVEVEEGEEEGEEGGAVEVMDEDVIGQDEGNPGPAAAGGQP